MFTLDLNVNCMYDDVAILKNSYPILKEGKSRIGLYVLESGLKLSIACLTYRIYRLQLNFVGNVKSLDYGLADDHILYMQDDHVLENVFHANFRSLLVIAQASISIRRCKLT